MADVSDSLSTFDKIHKSWGCPGEDIIEVGTRIWFAKGRSEASMFHHPVSGRTQEKWRFDEQEVKLVIIDGEMRFPRVRWLRLMGEIGVSGVDNEHGDYTSNEKDRFSNYINRYTGTAKLRDLNRYQINLGVRILGQDAFWTKKPYRSSLTFYFGYRQHDENFTITHSRQIITNSVQTNTVLRSNSRYYFNYEMPQVGLKAHLGFDDMCKGLKGLIDFSYMFGYFTGHGYDADTGRSWDDTSGGYGPALRVGLEYRRKWWSASFGYEWTWIKGEDGYRENGIPGDDDFEYTNTHRYGLYFGLGVRF